MSPPLRRALCGASLAALAPAAALAATPSAVAPVVVTATRLPTFLVDAPDVQVIDRSQIDLRQATYATDMLDTVPGLAVSSNGAFGGVASVRIRGASSDKTLVLIDGVPQNDPSDPNGAYDFSSLDLSDIERIEILQGPQSSLWGSDAIGGVVSLTTRETDGWRASAEGGSLNTFDGSAAVGRSTDKWAIGASLFGDRTDGVAKADGIGPRNPYWSWSAGAYGRFTPSNRLSLDARFRYDQSYAGVDGYDATTFAFGYTPQYARTRGWTGDLRAVAALPAAFTGTLSVGLFDYDHSDTYQGQPSLSSSYTASTQDYRFTAERGGAGDRFAVDFGAERLQSRASLSTGASLDAGETDGFVLARFRPIEPLTLTAAERYDAPDRFGGEATAHASAVLKLPAGFSVEGAVGQGFKTPTISEIACDFCTPAGPSAGLKPEHALGWDGALAWASPKGGYRVKLTGYHLQVRDEIEFASAFPFRYVNVARTRTNGLELEADARLTQALSLHGEYAYTDAASLDPTTPMLRVPKNSGSITLAWRGRRWRSALTVRAEGPDADIDPFDFVPATRPGFAVADLAVGYQLTPRLELTARIDDLLNSRYEEALGYGEPRQSILFGLRAKG